MYGNVREGCADWCSPNYYLESSPHDLPGDPPGPATGELPVVRGVCLMDLPPFIRSAERLCVTSQLPQNNHGFCVARTVTDATITVCRPCPSQRSYAPLSCVRPTTAPTDAAVAPHLAGE